ncbi:MAG: pyridoxal kinase [Hyphomicrobiales bacterium]|mgnify:CR=1 FL=1|nr:MAG: pyridoxal kinase [Hyphomicrobiales bacterium]
MPAPVRKPAIIVITSLVARGSVGGRGVVFALERLGFPVWFVPTITLSWHPGHGPSTRLVPDMDGFAAMLADLANSPWIDQVGGILTGYLGSPEQAEAIAGLIGKAREKNPDLLYLCDPISGDAGRLYVPEPTAEAIRDRLLPLADIATPNAFELAWLSGMPVTTPAEAEAAARTLSPPRMVVSSAPALFGNAMATMLVAKAASSAIVAEHPAIANAPNGPGDLLSSLFLAHLLDGANEETALGRATATAFELVARSVKAGADELWLTTEQGSIVRPTAMVTMRRLQTPTIRRKANAPDSGDAG